VNLVRKKIFTYKDVFTFLICILLLPIQFTGCGNCRTGEIKQDKGDTQNKDSTQSGQNESVEKEKPASTYIIGTSVSGIPIAVTEIGAGYETGVVIIGAIHGNEANTALLVKALSSWYMNRPELVPGHIRLFFLPALNPDGLKLKTRENMHNVDLNRNFPTDDWKSNAVSPSDVRFGSGGASPASEPEVKLFIEWINNKVRKTAGSVYLISFHAAYPPAGSVQPGYAVYGSPGKESGRFAGFLAGSSGFRFLRTWVTAKQLTGELIHWCELNGIYSCDIELPDYNPPGTILQGRNESIVDIFKRVIGDVVSGFFRKE
jgi:hypothetical protein